MKENIVGRLNEQELLGKALESKESEFIAIYGRRRVGKTFLVREYFDTDIAFQCSGLSNQNTAAQLYNFNSTLNRYQRSRETAPKSWLEAFDRLITYLEGLEEKKKIVFLDELPWMDTAGSDFIAALEHFWNGWASARHDIVLIVCGSATSWMMDKLINNHGGLYGRLTCRIFLQPFTLKESQLFLEKNNVHLSSYEMAECYMILGGIPYYLKALDGRFSLAQNIDRLLFNPNGPLYDEFSHLYAALFKDSDKYIAVVKALSTKGIGLTRKEIIDISGIPSGSGLTRILDNLESCGFIRRYQNYPLSGRNNLFQLIDFFTLFYFRFLSKSSFRKLQSWQNIQRTPAFYAWAGYSYELIALTHVADIKAKLGISGVVTNTYSWRSKEEDNSEGAQIDLVIDRQDNTINICEVKFTEAPFEIDSKYELTLRNKIAVFTQQTHTHKSIQLTLITTYGCLHNSHYGVVQNEVTLQDFLAH